MPRQECLGSHEDEKLVELLSSEGLGFDGEPVALVVEKQDALFAEFLSENPVFRQRVIDSLLLSTIDPRFR
jgi:hypothetical protein